MSAGKHKLQIELDGTYEQAVEFIQRTVFALPRAIGEAGGGRVTGEFMPDRPGDLRGPNLLLTLECLIYASTPPLKGEG